MINLFNSFLTGHYLLIIAQSIILVLALVHILLNKTRPSAMLGWAAIIILAPIFGGLFYYVFGISRVKRRAVKLHDITQPYNAATHSPSHLSTQEIEPFTPTLPQQTLPSSFLPGSQLTPYQAHNCTEISHFQSPDDAYEAMLLSIKQAKQKICLTTYIFDADAIGLQFVQALQTAKANGVQIQIIIDGIGAINQWPKLTSIAWPLLKSDINFKQFIPPRLLPPSFSVNLRNHRKLLVIDEATVFTGGLNISQRHSQTQYASKRGKWQKIKGFKAPVDDLHFKFTGAIARDCQHIFDADWAFVSATEPPKNLAHQYSKTEFSQQSRHETWVRAISDGPSDAWNRFAALFHGQISRASHKVTIVTPYFIPTSSMLDAIQTATLHGVNVDIYLPQILDQKIMQWARMHIIKEAIESGANIYFREEPFSHTKLFLVDDDYCFVGSPNWDPRSLMLNYESGIECHDAALSQALWHYVAGIRKSSKLYTVMDYNAISLVKKIRNSIAWMSSPYL